jgi:formamidopyrimidine-DNA glycosylase
MFCEGKGKYIMIELPEGIVLAKQINSELKNKKIKKMVADSSHHAFAWYNGDPKGYSTMFAGKVIEGSHSYGGKLHVTLSDNCEFVFCDGTSIRYYTDNRKLPKKHQLYIEFDDSTHLICTIRMYGGLFGYTGEYDNGYDYIARTKTSPLSDEFTKTYFKSLLNTAKKAKLSAKAFLATEQRIPGLGNGVLHDILFNACISPRRDMSTVSAKEFDDLFDSVKDTLKEMLEKGGRDVETDIYGKPGGYKTILSKNTYNEPCPRCEGTIKKEAYLGGSVYYCPDCQK